MAPLAGVATAGAPFALRTLRLRLEYQPQYLTSCS